MNKKEISKYMSKLGKKARKLHPYSSERMKQVRAVGVAKQRAIRELSPDSE